MTYIPVAFRNHRLGTDVSGATNLGQALDLAGMNWGLEVVPADDLAIRKTNEDGEKSGWVKTRAPGQRFVMRNDNWDTLGVVRGSYQGVINYDAFGVAEAMVQQLPGTQYSRAFDRDFGRQNYLELRMPEYDVRVGDGDLDVIYAGMRFETTHDGGGSIKGTVTMERKVCTNGMIVSIGGVEHQYKIRHTLSAQDRLVASQKLAVKAGAYIQEFSRYANFLINTKMSFEDFLAFVDDLYPRPEVHATSRFAMTPAERRATGSWERRRAELINLFMRAETQESGRGTRWAAFNAVTEQADWSGTVRQGSAESVDQARALRQLDGTQQTIKDLAWTNLTLAA
jgi:phage/plasmid-like protein (TIGR03299 family)